MKFTPAQKRALDEVSPPKKRTFLGIMKTLLILQIVPAIAGTLIWTSFFGGPSWAKNMADVAVWLILAFALFVSSVMLMMYILPHLADDRKARQKIVFDESYIGLCYPRIIPFVYGLLGCVALACTLAAVGWTIRSFLYATLIIASHVLRHLCRGNAQKELDYVEDSHLKRLKLVEENENEL